MKTHELLIPFYFGSLEEENRLAVERDLLEDPEILVEYLDLKRSIEAAQTVPQMPSQKLWGRLEKNLTTKKKWLYSLSLGAAIAAALLLFFYAKPESQNHATEILFDASPELPASSGVL
jgi:hypothetical protein